MMCSYIYTNMYATIFTYMCLWIYNNVASVWQ